MVAAQTDGQVRDVDDCVRLRRQKKLDMISDISIKLRRRLDCKESTAGNYLHENTDKEITTYAANLAPRLRHKTWKVVRQNASEPTA